ncbi:Serine/threonine-protein phosphatase 4 regulatory subunit 4 [Gracilaria domingensis]|nr:Serine/threonine-protein phosphatase 4 regulatory subunit 4 [Gracilaria domingensis]
MRWTAQEIKDVIALVDIHATEQLYTSRKVAARVVGALAQCLDKQKVEHIILPRALRLFDDSDIEVRGMVVESLAQIGAALPIRVTEQAVWPRIERLLEPPEEARLRASAMRTMAHILESHRSNGTPSRLFRELLPPVFARLSAFAKKFSAEDQRLVDDNTYLLLEVASEIFGQFTYSLALFTKKSFRREAYKAYTGMATCNGPIIRRNCAFNLPGVAKALGDKYALELSGLCDYLANDTDEEVRFILAAGIHETTALLAPRGNFERLFTAVCSLLQDENAMVRMNALAHFHDLLTAFARDGSDPASVRRLAPVFSDLTVLSEGEWRIQKSLAEQLAKCAEIIPADALMDHVLPLLYRLTSQGTPLVREAAMDATIKSIRNIPNPKERNSAIEKYWKAATRGPFWMRLALLDGGTAAMRVFSHRRFQELFSGHMLSLASDPVVNVRIRLATLLPSMAPMCGGTAAYEKAISILKCDEDVDVLAIMKKHPDRVNEAMRRAIERRVEDQARYREEQEYYGFSPRTQKRARGRLGSTRGNRRIMHVRRPSLEQSSGQLSVSKAVISAAKASSAAASMMKPSAYHNQKLPEVDSAVYLDPSMVEMGVDGTYPNGMLDDPSGNSKGEESILSNLVNESLQPSTSVEMLNGPRSNGLHPHVSALFEQQQRLQSQQHTQTKHHQTGMKRDAPKIINNGIAVKEQSMGKNAPQNTRYEARSRSWNGMFAQLPRQLSMESRSRRNGRTEGKEKSQKVMGWGKQGKDTPKKTLSALRRKKKSHTNPPAPSQNTVPLEGHTGGAGVPIVTAGEFGLNGPQVVSARSNSISVPPSGNTDDRRLSENEDVADFASTGSLPTAEHALSGMASDENHTGYANQRVLAATHDVHGSKYANGHINGSLEEGNTLPVIFEKDSGLTPLKGGAAWRRSRGRHEDLDTMSDATHRKVYGQYDGRHRNDENGQTPSRTALSSFHNSASKVFNPKTSGSPSAGPPLTPNGTAVRSANGGSSSGSSHIGFFRGLFRRRR